MGLGYSPEFRSQKNGQKGPFLAISGSGKGPDGPSGGGIERGKVAEPSTTGPVELKVLSGEILPRVPGFQLFAKSTRYGRFRLNESLRSVPPGRVRQPNSSATSSTPVGHLGSIGEASRGLGAKHTKTGHFGAFLAEFRLRAGGFSRIWAVLMTPSDPQAFKPISRPFVSFNKAGKCSKVPQTAAEIAEFRIPAKSPEHPENFRTHPRKVRSKFEVHS